MHASTTTLRVLLDINPYSLDERYREQLKAACPDVELLDCAAGGLLEEWVDGEIDVLVTEQVPRNIADWRNLRLVQLLSAGANQLAGHPITETAIPVCSASGAGSVPIAQFVTGALLMMTHRLPEILEFKKTRLWPNRLGLAGSSVRGLSAGIIGYGSIGRECARQLDALGIRILCMKRDPTTRSDDGYNAWPGSGDPKGIIPAGWFSPAQMSEMLPQCDFLIVTAPATPRTMGMIGKPEIALLKPTTRIVVVSRGGIVDETALADALRDGRIAGAAVDCFVREPLPVDHPFFDSPNLMLTPHMAGVHRGLWPALVGLLCENLVRLDNGLPLLNRVNICLGY